MSRPAAALLSAAMLVLLGLDSIPLPIPVQIAPVSSLIALAMLPLAISRFQVTPLFTVVVAFFGYVLLHSLVALVLDFGILGQPNARATMWLRQLVALTAGISVYVVLRTALAGSSEARIRKLVLIGAAPAIALGLVNIVWGVTGSGAAGGLVRGVRGVVSPMGFTAPWRASGLSGEPALFALFLGLVVIPMLLLGLHASKRRLPLLAYLVATLLAFAWTFSATGAAVLFILCGLGLLLGPERLLFGGALAAAVLGVVLLLLAVPDNYAVHQVTALLQGQLDLSGTTKFFSTLEPVRRMDRSLVPIGYGLGGSPFHLESVVSPETYRDIVAVSWENAPNLKTWWGRVLTETGLVGVALVGLVVIIAGWQAVGLRDRTPPAERRLGRMAIPAVTAYLFGATVASGLGSFALPSLWFWLAVLDSRYLQARGTSLAPVAAAPSTNFTVPGFRGHPETL